MNDPKLNQPPSREKIFRAIQLLMLVDIAVGGVLVLLGLFVLNFPELAIAGAFLACMGFGLALLFRQLSRRAAAEESSAAERPEPFVAGAGPLPPAGAASLFAMPTRAGRNRRSLIV